MPLEYPSYTFADVEHLEQRTLLTSVTFLNGNLSIALSEGNAVLTISDAGVLQMNGEDITHNGGQSLVASTVKNITVQAADTGATIDLSGLSSDRLHHQFKGAHIIGGNGDDSLVGTDGNDTVEGGNGADYLNGRNGDDVLIDGLGDGDIHGNPGDDIIVIANATGVYDTQTGDGWKDIHGEHGRDFIAEQYVIEQVLGVSDITTSTSVQLRNAYLQALQTHGADGLRGIIDTHRGEHDRAAPALWGTGQNREGFGDTVIVTTSASPEQVAADGRVNGVFTFTGHDDIFVHTPAHSLDINAGDGNDTIYGSVHDDAIRPSNGHDVVYAADGDDTIIAQAEQPDGSIIILSGNKTIHAGPGNDTVVSGSGNDIIFGEDGDDNLVGSSGDDVIHGGGGSDNLLGSAGADSLFGNAGDDDLRGNSGKDMLDGGEGADIVNARSHHVEITTTHVFAGHTDIAQADTHTGMEGLRAQGTSGGDFIDISQSGFTGHSQIIAGNGNDTIFGSRGNDTISGGNGDDLINGANGDDVIFGNAGDDTIQGGKGNDIISGNAGNDVYNLAVTRDARFTADTVFATTRGTDSWSQMEAVIVSGTTANDIVRIEQGVVHSFTILLRNGNDKVISDGEGSVTFSGGNGSDTLLGNQQADETFHGQGGTDVYNSAVDTVFSAEIELP